MTIVAMVRDSAMTSLISFRYFFLEILRKHSVSEDGFTSLLSSLALVTVKERCIWNKVEFKPFRSYRI